ncbi:MAG: LacI family transcriptional regulator [Frankiales bacterium]|nr:LacI family transcriptional regulator [Frankiales bacterium]
MTAPSDQRQNGQPARAAFSAPTLEQVASIAGVSRATVSRVINDSPRVSETALARVREAILELGYVPNRAARSLVTRRTDSVALIVSEQDQRVFADPFFGGIIRALSAGLAETQLQLVLLMTQTGQDHERLGRYAKAHVDGALVVSAHDSDPVPAILAEARLPTVLMGRSFAQDVPSLPWVDADNHGGGRTAVEHLHSKGRRRIAHISGPGDMSAACDRLRGYRDGLEAHGIAFDPTLVAEGHFLEQGGYEAMRELLERHPDIDGLFSASDLMASGALHALADAGRTVPGDISVVGFDDTIVASHTRPRLTTIRQPIDVMGRTMIDLLVRKIAGDSDIQNAELPIELILRDST